MATSTRLADASGPSVGAGLRPGRARIESLETLRGGAAAVIAAHHIVAYGPLSDRAAELAPGLVSWLWDYGRMAVQVFLVITGVVTALSVAAAPSGPGGFARYAARRWVRLGVPCTGAILYLLALRAAIPRRLDAFEPFGSLSWGQLLAHAVFLQDILGYESLSAGLWYLGIDFQFGLVFCLALSAERGLARALGLGPGRADRWLRLGIWLPAALLSVFVVNRRPEADEWVVYYLGSLCVGVMCGWALSGRVPAWAFWGYGGAVAAGLAFDWRPRLALALAAGVLIYALGRAEGRQARLARPPLRWLGRISYSLFLVHYPTAWAVESLGGAFWNRSAWTALLGMAVAFAASLAAAAVFWRLVERPSRSLAESLRPA